MSGLFGSKPESPKPTRMPDTEDPEAKEARRRKIADMRQRGGRQSTILSDNLIGASGSLGE